MKTSGTPWTTGIVKTLLISILLIGLSVTTYSQDSLAYLSPSDIWWLSDTVQKDVAKKLTERVTLIQKDSLCKVEKENLLFQLGVINDKVYTYKEEVRLLNSVVEDYKLKEGLYKEKIELRDSRIKKLKTQKTIIIIGAAIISGLSLGLGLGL